MLHQTSSAGWYQSMQGDIVGSISRLPPDSREGCTILFYLAHCQGLSMPKGNLRVITNLESDNPLLESWRQAGAIAFVRGGYVFA
jgi:hypothetical protein